MTINLTEIYDVTLKKYIRGAAKDGFVRPTLGECFMTHKDFKEINNSLTLVGYTEDLCTTPSNAMSDYDALLRVAARAFGNTSVSYTTTAWHGDITVNPGNTYIGYNFGVPVRIEKYTLVTTNVSPEIDSIKSWEFQGSNGGEWTTIHTVVNSPIWGVLEKRSFTFNNENTYTQYRFLITAIFGIKDLIIDEIEMMEGIYE